MDFLFSYPTIGIFIAIILIIIGLKIAKWIFWSLAIVVIIAAVGAYFVLPGEQASDQLIGGDTDEHGCLIAAGYSWCETKQKCLRTWEELCPESFCDAENTTEVQICGDYVKITSPLEGAGSTYYKEDLTGNRTEFTCPIVAPDAMTPECEAVFNISCGGNVCEG